MSNALSDERLFFGAVLAELAKARAKFPEQNVWLTLAALTEEVGELNKDILHYNFERHKGKTVASIYAEAVQVAVMAMRVVLDCDLKDPAGKNP